MKKVSILMGIFNCGDTLREAVDSIIEQTYENWELIMCDDGSTDNTYALACELQKKAPDKIILIKHEKNQGLNRTLNDCLEKAGGEYIARMDGDDISLPERLEQEVSFLESNPQYALVGCRLKLFDKNGIWGVSRAVEKPQPQDFIYGNPFSHPTCMMCSEAIRSVGGYSEHVRTMRNEDYDLWFRLYEKGYRGYNLQTPYYLFRDDDAAYRRRKYKWRVNEAYVMFTGFRRLHLPVYLYAFAVKPLIVGLLPKKIYMVLHHKKKDENVQ